MQQYNKMRFIYVTTYEREDSDMKANSEIKFSVKIKFCKVL